VGVVVDSSPLVPFRFERFTETDAMFGSRNSKEKLQKKYNKLLQEAFDLSTVNRKKSDMKRAEAEEIGRQLDEMGKKD
jgi:hypothetical protein